MREKPFKCKCGHTKDFVEVCDVALIEVDGLGKRKEILEANVTHYECPGCATEISYEKFNQEED